jgi:uncharacterized protein
VTGASGGLGRAITRALARRGALLVLSGRNADQLQTIAGEVSGRAVPADLSRPEEVGRLLEEAGELDILVANAGLPGSGDLEELRQDQIERVIDVNLASPMAMTRALLPRFRSRGSGHFVYVSSLSGKVASPLSSVYAATKFGLRGFADGLRCDLQGSGIGCSVVLPSFVRDAGLFADTGVSLPPGIGTVTSREVGDAVVRAIETNRAEITVAPLLLRIGAVLGGAYPGLSAPFQRRLDRGLSARISQAQQGKREPAGPGAGGKPGKGNKGPGREGSFGA